MRGERYHEMPWIPVPLGLLSGEVWWLLSVAICFPFSELRHSSVPFGMSHSTESHITGQST